MPGDSARASPRSTARSLLARTPTAIRRRFGAGERVLVAVRRTRLEHGQRIPGRGPQVFEIAAYKTLRPVILDLGIGGVLGIGHNTAKYETVWSPQGAEDTHAAWRVVRTEQGLPLDAMITLSVYLWQRRYFDDVVFDRCSSFPVDGRDVPLPFDQMYAGVSIDPIQFLDIRAAYVLRTSKPHRPPGADRADRHVGHAATPGHAQRIPRLASSPSRSARICSTAGFGRASDR